MPPNVLPPVPPKGSPARPCNHSSKDPHPMSDPFGRRVRTYTHAGQTYFDLAEIAYALRAANVDRLAGNLDADEVLPLSAITGDPIDAETLLVTEPAVFRIAIRMRHPAARKLLRFVTHTVLPSLRETGSYRLLRKGADGAEVVRFIRDQLDGVSSIADTVGPAEATATRSDQPISSDEG